MTPLEVFVGLRCRVEGWPLQPPIPERSREPLAELTRGVIAKLGWIGPPPEVVLTRRGATLRIDADLADGDAQWRELAQLSAVAMVMSQTRPLWLWTVRDAGGLLRRKLQSPDLVAWRGIYGTHTTPTPEWSPSRVRKDRAFDAKVRWVLSQVIEAELRQLGIRIPEPLDGDGRPSSPRLLLFDYEPGEDWQHKGSEAQSLAIIGRSMLQLDGRSTRTGRWKASLRAEVLNPSDMPLAGVRVQARLRDAEGILIGVVDASDGEIPPGAVRLVSAATEVDLGSLSVTSIDLGCEALLSRAVSFTATIREV
jgi:hypothetical protein